MVAVEDRPGQGSAGRVSGLERVFDELGAHVVGDRPAGEATRVAVDDGGQVQVRPVGERQVRDVTDIAFVGCGGREVTLEQVGHLLTRGFGDRGPHPPALGVAADAVLAHHPRDPLVVHPLLGGLVVVEFGGRTWRTDGVVLGMDRSDLLGELGIRSRTSRTAWGALAPGVVGRTLDLDELAQSLHLEGGGVVGDELEATHQRVSPAKYLALCG